MNASLRSTFWHIYLLVGLQESLAFVSPLARAAITSVSLRSIPNDRPQMIPSDLGEDHIFGLSTLHNAASSSVILSDTDWVGLSKTIGLGILGVFVFFTLLTFVTVNVLMPAAAKQVEEITKEVDPDLWDEYTSKLKPGETLATRPDLVQELGRRVIDLQNRQLEMQEAAVRQRKDKGTAENSGPGVEAGDEEPSVKREPIILEVKDKNQWND